MKCQNIMFHHTAYIGHEDVQTSISSIRVCKNTKIEKFEISFLDHTNIVSTFNTKNIAIKIITDTNKQLDTIEFLTTKKKIIASIHIKGNLDKTIYQKYINAMAI